MASRNKYPNYGNDYCYTEYERAESSKARSEKGVGRGYSTCDGIKNVDQRTILGGEIGWLREIPVDDAGPLKMQYVVQDVTVAVANLRQKRETEYLEGGYPQGV